MLFQYKLLLTHTPQEQMLAFADHVEAASLFERYQGKTIS